MRTSCAKNGPLFIFAGLVKLSKIPGIVHRFLSAGLNSSLCASTWDCNKPLQVHHSMYNTSLLTTAANLAFSYWKTGVCTALVFESN